MKQSEIEAYLIKNCGRVPSYLRNDKDRLFWDLFTRHKKFIPVARDMGVSVSALITRGIRLTYQMRVDDQRQEVEDEKRRGDFIGLRPQYESRDRKFNKYLIRKNVRFT